MTKGAVMAPFAWFKRANGVTRQQQFKIMIDFIKAQVIGANVSALRDNPLLEFTTSLNETTGEVGRQSNKTARSWATYCGLTFVIYENRSVYLSGSLHKYWNRGAHNYNDFTLGAIHEVLNDLTDKFNISPGQIVLQNLEIGVNITPPYPTGHLLEHCFLHSTTPFENRINNGRGRFIQAEHQQYSIKIYDKARQYRGQGYYVEGEIIRFEVKFSKSTRLVQLGVKSVKELADKLEVFTEILASEWRKVLFYDFTIKHHSQVLLRYRNPIFWHKIKVKSSTFKKHRRQLKEMTENYSDNIPQQIENLIRGKAIQLTARGTQINRTSNLNRGTQINHTFEELALPREVNKGTHINNLDKGLKRVPPEKLYCIVTGVDISMQRKGSRLLQTGGLRYYREHDHAFFEEIIRAYMPKSHSGTPIRKQIEETAHAIRDRARPSRKTRVSRYNPQQLRNGLFK